MMNANKELSRISVRTLAERLALGEPLALLDVREPREREHCLIAVPETSVDVHMPLQSIPGRLAELKEALGSRPLVVYCHHGVRSLMVAEWLVAQGLTNVNNLEGGIDAWSIVVDPGVARY